jgi:uncharacterized protein YgfB (UPF0149 family)
MDISIDHDQLEAALRRCGSTWDSSQAHGLLCGRLAVLGTDGAMMWLEQVLEGLSPDDALRAECESMLETLFQTTWKQLAERQSELDLLLPDDEEDVAVRAEALGHWCEGFLHGVVSGKYPEKLKSRLAEEPVSSLIKDMLEITRAAFGEDDDDETNEQAYTELVEYVRVGVQLIYEELAELRAGGSRTAISDAVSNALH